MLAAGFPVSRVAEIKAVIDPTTSEAAAPTIEPIRNTTWPKRRESTSTPECDNRGQTPWLSPPYPLPVLPCE